jgi:hypothetical protein
MNVRAASTSVWGGFTGGKIMEPAAGQHGQVDVPFWRMTKVLAI